MITFPSSWVKSRTKRKVERCCLEGILKMERKRWFQSMYNWRMSYRKLNLILNLINRQCRKHLWRMIYHRSWNHRWCFIRVRLYRRIWWWYVGSGAVLERRRTPHKQGLVERKRARAMRLQIIRGLLSIFGVSLTPGISCMSWKMVPNNKVKLRTIIQQL